MAFRYLGDNRGALRYLGDKKGPFRLLTLNKALRDFDGPQKVARLRYSFVYVREKSHVESPPSVAEDCRSPY